MKIEYKFVNETKEIEVDEKLFNEIKELDRQLYNNNQRESRRHCSASLLSDKYDYEIADTANFENEIFNVDDFERIIAPLNNEQKDLLRRVFFYGEKSVDIAREMGVGKTAIANRLKRAYAQIKKNLTAPREL